MAAHLKRAFDTRHHCLQQFARIGRKVNLACGKSSRYHYRITALHIFGFGRWGRCDGQLVDDVGSTILSRCSVDDGLLVAASGTWPSSESLLPSHKALWATGLGAAGAMGDVGVSTGKADAAATGPALQHETAEPGPRPVIHSQMSTIKAKTAMIHVHRK